MIAGLRVHITGSAAVDCETGLLRSAHEYVRALTGEVVGQGGGLVLGVGNEPIGSNGQPCIFDWTALECVATVVDMSSNWPAVRLERFVTVASQRGLDRIPSSRGVLWRTCLARSDFDLEVAPPGWRMAGIIREHQVSRGDVLLVIGGGAGAEHLAEMYLDEGKPVIPISTQLGALNNDGNGGSRYLHGRAMAAPDRFLRLRDGAGSAAGRLSQLRLSAETDATTLAAATLELLKSLRPRPAFYVRLLATDHPDFHPVELFFREVVDAVIEERGFTPYEMGRGRPEAAFMNVEIFEGIHRAGLVVVDLTGVRPNCMMELGYALGRRRRVVMSAREGTQLTFDQDKLPTHFWEPTGEHEGLVVSYREWFDRHSDLPPIVSSQRP